jgi:hypothetical protein
MTARTDRWFAVAVRDAADLWLYLEIKRSWKSDVYVFWPYDQQDDLHISYHADGRWYVKSSGHGSGGHWQQRPDAILVDSQRIVTTPIHLEGVRASPIPCRHARSGAAYTDVVTIQADEISKSREKYCTSLAIDLAAAGAPPSVPNMIRHGVFTDAVPHIHVTLWDPGELLKSIEEQRRPQSP